jgi:glycosyltransferase involved in cell wall biosynthesis
MRILYLAPNIPVPGSHGGSTHVTSVHRALGKRHDVLTVGARSSTEPGVIPVGFTVGSPIMPPYYFARVVGAARRFQPDVIYERYSAFGLGIALRAVTGAACVLMTLDRDASPISFHFSDRIVATSDEFIPPRYRGKFREVRWGVDVEKLAGVSSAASARLKQEIAPNGERVIVYTGSFHDWHGLDLLVDAAERWTGPPVVFALIGDGPDTPRVRRLAEARGLGRQFVFPGRVPHDAIGPYIAAADVCIAPYAPSRHAIFRKHGMNRDPIKVLEYMALGKPTVTIDTPRMRVLFRADEEAVLYPPDDAAALSAALSSLLADPARMKRIGDAGEALVRSRFSWDRHAEELTAIFNEAVEARRSKR